MFSVAEFIRILTVQHNVIQMQTEGLTQAETLIQPQPAGNCMNWVLGHTLESQLTVLNLLGGELPVDLDELAAYRRESTPIAGDGPGVLPLERLLDGHARVNERILARLAEMEEADFDREVQHRDRLVPLSWRLLFLNFHYSYHLGQLELLRQLAGRTEKLI